MLLEENYFTLIIWLLFHSNIQRSYVRPECNWYFKLVWSLKQRVGGGYQCLRVVLKNCVFARLLTNCLTFEWLGWHLGGLDPKNSFFDFGLKGVTNSQNGCQNISPLQNPVHATVENSIFLGNLLSLYGTSPTWQWMDHSYKRAKDIYVKT